LNTESSFLPLIGYKPGQHEMELSADMKHVAQPLRYQNYIAFPEVDLM